MSIPDRIGETDRRNFIYCLKVTFFKLFLELLYSLESPPLLVKLSNKEI